MGNSASTSTTGGRRRLIIASGSLLAIAGLISSGAFTDFANLNIGNGTASGGIGGNNSFNVQVVGTDAQGTPVPGTWQEADTAAGANIAILNADALAPGDTVSVDIPFQNASPKLSAALTFSLQDNPSLTSDAALDGALRYTVSTVTPPASGTGAAVVTPLATNATKTAVQALNLGLLAHGASSTLRIAISLPNQSTQASNNALQAKHVYVQAHFAAESVQP